MSGKREKRLRAQRKLQFLEEFRIWLLSEPSMLAIISWHRWKKNRPPFPDFFW